MPGAGAQGNDVLLIGEPFDQAGGMTPGQVLQADFTVGGTTVFAAGAGNDSLGWSVATNGDADGDGLVDVLVAAIGVPDARLFPGAGGAPTVLTGSGLASQGPAAFVGDVNGNGFTDMGLSFSTSPAGTVELLAGGPGATSNPAFGPGCARAPGGLAALAQNGPLVPGTSVTFTASNLAGYDSLWLQIGVPDAAGQTLPSGCVLWLQNESTLETIPSLGGATTWTSAPVAIPNDLTLLGLALGFQTVHLPAGGGLGQLATTNAISSTIGW